VRRSRRRIIYGMLAKSGSKEANRVLPVKCLNQWLQTSSAGDAQAAVPEPTEFCGKKGIAQPQRTKGASAQMILASSRRCQEEWLRCGAEGCRPTASASRARCGPTHSRPMQDKQGDGRRGRRTPRPETFAHKAFGVAVAFQTAAGGRDTCGVDIMGAGPRD